MVILEKKVEQFIFRVEVDFLFPAECSTKVEKNKKKRRVSCDPSLYNSSVFNEVAPFKTTKANVSIIKELKIYSFNKGARAGREISTNNWQITVEPEN